MKTGGLLKTLKSTIRHTTMTDKNRTQHHFADDIVDDFDKNEVKIEE